MFKLVEKKSWGRGRGGLRVARLDAKGRLHIGNDLGASLGITSFRQCDVFFDETTCRAAISFEKIGENPRHFRFYAKGGAKIFTPFADLLGVKELTYFRLEPESQDGRKLYVLVPVEGKE